jgi:arginase
VKRSIALVGVPSSAGARRRGQELAPARLRRAGLVEQLRTAGCEVIDCGDLSTISFTPDEQNPRHQNLPLVRAVLTGVVEAVDQALAHYALPLVIGGDCTITIGVLAGLSRRFPSLGMMYLDGDIDLNTPRTTTSGILDGMGLAHITGKGAKELTHLGTGYPLLLEPNITLFGYCIEAGGIDPLELDLLDRSAMRTFPADVIRGKVQTVAARAIGELEDRVDHVLIHFDVDVIDFDDFPAADVPHRGGLSFEEATSALTVFLASPKVVGLTLTEFNADRDPDGILAARLVTAVVAAIAGTGQAETAPAIRV